MTTFTIETETNNITANANAQDAEALTKARCFDSEEALGALATEWSTPRLVEIWNGPPGATAVTKFKNRRIAISRVWKALQSLAESLPNETAPEHANEPVAFAEVGEGPAVEPVLAQPEPDAGAQAPDVALEPTEPIKKATRATKAKMGEPKAPRAESKASQIIAMLRREGGTTLEEIMDATKWQKHTTRAMLSAGGSLTKSHGLAIISEKVGEQRRYSIKG
jgi:hypothetical protein